MKNYRLGSVVQFRHEINEVDITLIALMFTNMHKPLQKKTAKNILKSTTKNPSKFYEYSS